jgi:hypothetical protein
MQTNGEKNHATFNVDGEKYELSIVLITPEIATYIMENDNYNNRPISKINVKFLVNEMTRGNWRFDGAPIRFDDKNNLLDGRHRLNAIIESGLSFEFLVITGLSENSFKVMDTGRKRTGSDILSIAAIKNASLVASTVKFIYGFNNGLHSANRNSNRTLSNTELLEHYHILNEDGSLDNSVHIGKSESQKSKLINPTTVAGFHYLFSKINVEDANTFIKKLCTGEMLEGTSPIFVLRTKLIKVNDKKNDLKLTQQKLNALMVLAWNKFRTGEKCRVLKLPESSNDYTFDMI